jgi:hypothetical protein
MKPSDMIKNAKEIGKNILEIKHFAAKKNTSRTSVYRALADKKLNQVLLGKNSRFIVLDDLAKTWKPKKAN